MDPPPVGYERGDEPLGREAWGQGAGTDVGFQLRCERAQFAVVAEAVEQRDADPPGGVGAEAAG